MDAMTNMIQSGGFGTTGPVGYNPYMQPNNMIQFGGYQTPYQQQNQYVFQPIPQQQNNYYNPYATSFGNRANYYNPYGVDYNYSNPQYGYNNPYNYQYYRQSANAYQKMQEERMYLLKMKIKCSNAALGIEMTDDQIDMMINPNHPANRRTREEQEAYQNFQFIQKVNQAAEQEQKPISVQKALFDKSMAELAEYHKKYDDHSMCEFFSKDSGVLRWQDWLDLNTKPNTGRDMSDTYNSNSYNELLKLHRASSPYTISLLNQGYDNNKDDYEIGMQAMADREKRRQAILSGKVPDFISSPETQEYRHKWTQKVLSQIYEKEASKHV